MSAAYALTCPGLALQAEGTGPPINVCTGVEWHRFPSAFFLPGQRYRLQVRCALIKLHSVKDACACRAGLVCLYNAYRRAHFL